jgi:hypothetical protein
MRTGSTKSKVRSGEGPAAAPAIRHAVGRAAAGRRLRARMLTLLWVPVLCLLAGTPLPIRAQAISEHEVQAAFIYNFARFVTWPAAAFPGPTTPMRIAVLGNHRFADVLEKTVAEREVGGHPLKVLRCRNLKEAAGAHIMFVSKGQPWEPEQISKHFGKAAVLLVGEEEGFATHGGTINFVLRDEKVHFQINPVAARKAGLVISARLLSLAEIVIGE